MGTSSAIEAPLAQKPAVASAPPSVRSDRDGTERPADRRPRNPRKSRSISSANEIVGERPGSAPHVAPAGLPTSWPRDRQQAASMNYGMPYAFHVIENGVEEHPTTTAVAMPNGTHEYFSLAPVLIHHSGHGMVPYLTWDFSGYTAAATASYQAKPPRHNNSNNDNRRQQHYNNKRNSSNSSRQHRNGRTNGYSDSVIHAGNGNMRPSDSTISLAGYNGSEMDPLRGATSGAPASLGGASSDVASMRSVPCSPRSERRRNQHHRKFSTASIESLPAVTDGGGDAPDLERFLKASTPCVRLPSGAAAVAELRLSDLWKCFEQSSLFGLECAALGGPRGLSSCYFVPYLSAVHLYTPTVVGADGVEDDTVSTSSRNSIRSASSLAFNDSGSGVEEEVFSFPQGLDSWPTGMKRGFSWAAAEHVADRLPLHTRVTELATRDGTALEDHPIWCSKMVDLHPYSWFAVAWYPLYRIPDAPLTARFLTFHSMAPLWEAATAAERELKEAAAAAAAAVGGASAASYKLMLKAGGAHDLGSVGGGNGNETPTGLANAYPGSPFASEGTHSAAYGPASTAPSATTQGCGTSSDPSRCHSVASGSDPATIGSDAASLTRSFGSLTHSPATSDAGDDLLRSSDSGTSTHLPSKSRTAGCGFKGHTSTLSCPAVGLCWHTAGSAAGENWTDTLVAVDVPEEVYGRGLRLGDVLPGAANASVAGVWPRTAVIRKDYPLAKGGPLSWEIQLEELEEGARRLALRQGLVKINKPGNGNAAGEACGEEEEEEGLASCCPDYEFFSSRRR